MIWLKHDNVIYKLDNILRIFRYEEIRIIFSWNDLTENIFFASKEEADAAFKFICCHLTHTIPYIIELDYFLNKFRQEKEIP